MNSQTRIVMLVIFLVTNFVWLLISQISKHDYDARVESLTAELKTAWSNIDQLTVRNSAADREVAQMMTSQRRDRFDPANSSSVSASISCCLPSAYDMAETITSIPAPTTPYSPGTIYYGSVTNIESVEGDIYTCGRRAGVAEVGQMLANALAATLSVPSVNLEHPSKDFCDDIRRITGR